MDSTVESSINCDVRRCNEVSKWITHSTGFHSRVDDPPRPILRPLPIRPRTYDEATRLYRNRTYAFTCKVPAGWVLRTEQIKPDGAADTRSS